MPSTDLPHRKADAYSVVASQCPPPITGRTYLGIWIDRATHTLRAYLYEDGEYQSTLGVLEYATAPWAILGDPRWVRAHAAGDVVVFKTRFAGSDGIATWRPGVGINVIDTGFSAIGGPVVVGSSIYFQHEGISTDDPPVRTLQLYKIPLHSSGTLTESACHGDPLIDADFNLSVPTILCHSGGETFQVPSFWFGEGPLVRVPFFESGSWSMGVSRDLLSGDDPAPWSDGYAVGQQSLRLTYRPGFRPELGLMPRGSAAPNSPEIGLLPDITPAIDGIGGLSVSPTESEVALYPLWLNNETGNDRQQLFRIPTSGPYALPEGCPLPRILVQPGPDPRQPPAPAEGYPEAMLARD